MDYTIFFSIYIFCTFCAFSEFYELEILVISEQRIYSAKVFLTRPSNHAIFDPFGLLVMASQQTQNICITFIQCWTNLEDVGRRYIKVIQMFCVCLDGH